MLFRYSEGRDAYVLRGVGNLIGPVFQVRSALADAVTRDATGAR